MKYRFLTDYRHRWPSRAHTEYKAGMVMTLPRAVIAAAGDRVEVVGGGTADATGARLGNDEPELMKPTKGVKIRVRDMTEEETQAALIEALPEPAARPAPPEERIVRDGSKRISVRDGAGRASK